MKFKSYIKQKWLLSIIAVTLMIVYYLNFIQLPPAVSVELQQNYKYKLILIPLDTRPPMSKNGGRCRKNGRCTDYNTAVRDNGLLY